MEYYILHGHHNYVLILCETCSIIAWVCSIAYAVAYDSVSMRLEGRCGSPPP